MTLKSCKHTVSFSTLKNLNLLPNLQFLKSSEFIFIVLFESFKLFNK